MVDQSLSPQLCHIAFLCGCILLLDYQTHRWRWDEQARWCGIHSFVNAWIAALTWPSIHAILTSPFEAVRHQYYLNLPVYAVILLHAFHLLRFQCTTADYVHHALFVVVACVLTLFVPIGPIGEWLIFFGCGLPGCIDYGLWCAVHLGLCSRIVRLREALVMNLVLRGPGMCIGGFLFWMFFVVNWGTDSVSWSQLALFLASLVISAGNGQYYTAAVAMKCGAIGLKPHW